MFLSKYFTKEEPEPEKLATINVELQPDGSLDIECSWSKENQCNDLALAIGTILKMITTGGYDKLFSKALIKNCDQTNKQDIEFANQILDVWEVSKEQNQVIEKFNDKPLVSPLRTFGESNLGGGL